MQFSWTYRQVILAESGKLNARLNAREYSNLAKTTLSKKHSKAI